MSKKGENIYKRKDGRWEARYIRGYTESGEVRYGYCYGKTYIEAKEKQGAARAALLHCGLGETNTAVGRLSEYCGEWLQLKRSKIKLSTYVKYMTVIKNHIEPRLGACFVNTLTELTVEQFGYELMHNKGLSAKTVKDILTVLHAILVYAQKKSPSLHKPEIVYPRIEKKEMRVLSREEQERFVSYLSENTDRCKFGILLTLMTGLRIGELCALKWEDISLEDGTLYVKTAMQRIRRLSCDGKAKTEVIIATPKSFSSARVIPLSPLALKLCKRFCAEDNAYILTGSANKYLEPRALQHRIRRYADECGLSGIHFHTLRHSFATRCIEVGFEIKSLSEILGHAGPQITLERYVHSSLELKRENIMKLSEIGY